MEETDMEGPISIKEILAQLDGKLPMDEAVIEALPQGTTFLSVENLGTSCVWGARWHHAEGDFESSKELYRLMPDFIPEPFGFGRCKLQNPATFFYLSDFIDMDVTTAPEPVVFTGRLAEMHKTSQSPTSKFGFQVTTCDGKIAHTVEWEESWAVFYRKLLRGVCKLDLETNDPWPELERASEQVVSEIRV